MEGEALGPKYVSLGAAAAATGYSSATIRRWIRAGQVEALKGPTANSPYKVDVGSLTMFLRNVKTSKSTGSKRDSRRLPVVLDELATSIDERLEAGEVRRMSQDDLRELEAGMRNLGGWLDELGNAIEDRKDQL